MIVILGGNIYLVIWIIRLAIGKIMADRLLEHAWAFIFQMKV